MKTGIKGISQNKSGRFVVRMLKGGKHVYVGTYESLAEADAVLTVARNRENKRIAEAAAKAKKVLEGTLNA